eukprot:scaffold37218_cov16-Tisochrysis_lutea.AAC.1
MRRSFQKISIAPSLVHHTKCQEEGAHRLKGAVSPHPLHRKADRGMYVGFKLPAPEPGCEKVFGLCWRLVVASLPSVSIKQNEHGARMQAQ